MDAFDAVHSGLSDRKKADMAGDALLTQFFSNRVEFAQAAARFADAIATMLQKLSLIGTVKRPKRILLRSPR